MGGELSMKQLVDIILEMLPKLQELKLESGITAILVLYLIYLILKTVIR
jgi:hypothetical protein